MAAFKIFFKKSVEKDFYVIPKKDLKKILERIEALAEDPGPSGCYKLTGPESIGCGKGVIAIYILYKMMN